MQPDAHTSGPLRFRRFTALALVAGAVCGCQTYRLQGTVVPGLMPAVIEVEPRDPRLAQRGLEGALIELTLDPSSMRPVALGIIEADDLGRFDIPLEQAGVGFLEYDLGILCRAPGHMATYQVISVPPAGRQLLVLMARGRDTGPPAPDVLRETLELKEQLLRD